MTSTIPWTIDLGESFSEWSDDPLDLREPCASGLSFRFGCDGRMTATSSSSSMAASVGGVLSVSSQLSSPLAGVSPTNQRLLRTASSAISRTRRSSPLEPPVYSREEIHMLLLANQPQITHARWKHMNMAGLDLRGLDLSRLNLAGVDFSRCNFEGANFEGADITHCRFSQCNLKGANFQQVLVGDHEMACPFFTDADLSGADFTRYVGVLYRSCFEGVEDDMIGLELRWLR